jgi:hypothetical protein
VADNTVLNLGTGGDTMASDDIGGIKWQRVKIGLGADGTANDAVAGAGAVGTGVQRMTLASDDPAVVALQLLDNAISGNEMQVDIVAALPTGANVIGALTANQSVNVAQMNGVAVTMGNGVSGTGVQRVTLASDSTGVLASVGAITGSVVPGTGATNLGKAEDAVHASGDTGVMVLGVRQDSASALAANGDYIPFSMDSNGALRVVGSAGTTQYTEDVASTGAESLVLMGAIRRDTAVSSVSAAGDYDALATDANGNLRVAVSAGGIAGLADDAAFTVGTTEILGVGFLADETSTDSVNEGDIGAARITLDRKQINTPYLHAAAGGATPYKNLDVDESEDDIKTSAGKLFWIHVMNLHATDVRYLKIYNNVAASVTVGTTVPDLTFAIPPTNSGFMIPFGDAGLQFTTGICIAATTGLADNNSGAPGANEVILNAGYL